MKRFFAILILAATMAACSNPSEPSDTSIESPPSKGGTLEGIWYDKHGDRLTSDGLYDNYYGFYYKTDLRVSGDVVWYTAVGDVYHRVFYGIREGNVIRGTERLSLWSPSKGPHNTQEYANTFTR